MRTRESRPDGVRRMVEMPKNTQQAIAKLWSIGDRLKEYPDSRDNVDLLERIVSAMEQRPLPVEPQGWKSPEEAWLERERAFKTVPSGKEDYVLDCLTSEARDDERAEWTECMVKAIDLQEQEVPVDLRYEQPSSAQGPYAILRRALNVLPDNQREPMADVWIGRATRLGLIPQDQANRFLDIFVNLRDKAEILREEQRRT